MWEQIKTENIIEGEKYNFMDNQKFVHVGELHIIEFDDETLKNESNQILSQSKIINSKTKDVIKNVVRVWK